MIILTEKEYFLFNSKVLGYDQYRNKNYVKDRMGGELHS
jgi:hypothetical protein